MIKIDQLVKPIKVIRIDDDEIGCLYDFKKSKVENASLRITLYSVLEGSYGESAIDIVTLKESDDSIFFNIVIEKTDADKTLKEEVIRLILDNTDSYEEFKKDLISELSKVYTYSRMREITEEVFKEQIFIVTEWNDIELAIENKD